MESEELDDLVRRTFDLIPKTDMADYWVDYLHMCDALFLSTHANHSATNLQDLIDSQRAMLPWLTIYDNNQYSRWLGSLTSGACWQHYQRTVAISWRIISHIPLPVIHTPGKRLIC